MNIANFQEQLFHRTPLVAAIFAKSSIIDLWQGSVQSVVTYLIICDVLLPYVQFKNREKHPWRIFTFSKVVLPHGCFYVFQIVQMLPNRAKHHIWKFDEETY